MRNDTKGILQYGGLSLFDKNRPFGLILSRFVYVLTSQDIYQSVQFLCLYPANKRKTILCACVIRSDPYRVCEIVYAEVVLLMVSSLIVNRLLLRPSRKQG